MRVGELLFWGFFAKKCEPFGESDTFWQNLKRFGETPIQSGKTLYYLAKVGSFAKLYRVLLCVRNRNNQALHKVGNHHRCRQRIMQS